VTEKTFLNGIGIATADFRPVDNDDELTAALKAFGGSGILKTRRMGYDGKGQRVFRNMEAGGFAGTCEAMGNVPLILEAFVRFAGMHFFNPAPVMKLVEVIAGVQTGEATLERVRATGEAMGNGPLILEAFVPFEREISVIAARGIGGAVAAYDPAENVHRNGILHTSTLPAGMSAGTALAAQAAASKILSALDYVGVIGVEFFVLADGSLLANEIAPRVHNSGHWTEAACIVSQFEQHIRAVAGLPLGNPGRHSDCVMENLIGDDVLRVPELLSEPDLMLHLYGKAEARPGRKMGHFTRTSRRG